MMWRSPQVWSLTQHEAKEERTQSQLSHVKQSRSQLTSRQWVQILSTSIVFFNTWGLLLTMGVFQTYYEQTLLSRYSSSAISWISTTSAFVLLSGGVFTGPLYDLGYARQLLLAGSILQVLGLMMISLSAKYYQIFLAEAICVGLGAGIAFTPSVAAAAASIPDAAMRARCMGLMACGSSLGGIVYPIVFRYLLPKIGFPWTVRTMAFIALGLYVVSWVVIINKPNRSTAVRRFVDLAAIKDIRFVLLCLTGLLSSMAYYIPLLYLPLLTQRMIPSVGVNLEFDLISILNGASGVGRILAGFIAARYGQTETFQVAMFISSLLLFCWIALNSVAGTIVWTVFWGMFSGVLVALPGAFIPFFVPSISVLGTWSGMYWASVGLGSLIGGHIGGAIFDLDSTSSDGSWRMQVYAGVFMLAAGITMTYPVWYLRHTTNKRSPSSSSDDNDSTS